jgi:hypothetical protein
MAVLLLMPVALSAADVITGDYVESRTCDVYTGPCFANAESALAGKNAILAWSIESGAYQGVDLGGVKVIAAVSASDTLGWGGNVVVNPEPIQSLLIVDDKASQAQREAVTRLLQERAGMTLGTISAVKSAPIELAVDHVNMVAELKSGSSIKLLTRKLQRGDCICTNEEAFYPPLCEVDNAEPAYTIDGRFNTTGLGCTWSNPLTRSSYLATFAW